MQTDTQRLLNLWREQSDAFIDQLADDIRERSSPSYAALPREQLREAVSRTVRAWLSALEANDPAPLIDYARQITQQRAAEQVDVREIKRATDVLRERIWQLMGQVYAAGDWDVIYRAAKAGGLRLAPTAYDTRHT